MVTWIADKKSTDTLITIQLPDFLSTIQVTIQLMNRLSTWHIFTIQIPDVSGNRMPTVTIILILQSLKPVPTGLVFICPDCLTNLFLFNVFLCNFPGHFLIEFKDLFLFYFSHSFPCNTMPRNCVPYFERI